MKTKKTRQMLVTERMVAGKLMVRGEPTAPSKYHGKGSEGVRQCAGP
jgi:hypothetical protein